MNDTELFIQARDYLIQSIQPTLEAYFCGIWDPLIQFIVVREINSILAKDVVEKFPELPTKFQPRFKYRISGEREEIEINIQKYINKDSDLEYLGASGMGGVLYDLYHRDAYDGSNNTFFIARYGHTYDSYFGGSKTAEAEYHLGAMTPLSAAYAMAVQDGII